VERLAQLLDAGVAVFAPSGEVELAVGKPPTAALWAAIAARSQSLIVEADVEDWHAVATAIVRPGPGKPRWLAVASSRAGFAVRLAKAGAQAAAPLLAAVARLGDLARGQERALRSALLDEALRGGAGGEPGGLAARAAWLGIDFSAPARVALVVPPDARGARPGDAGAGLAALAEALERALADTGAAHLLAERDGTVVALVQGEEEELRAVLENLTANGARAGIGRAIDDVAAVPHSHRDAALAVRRMPPGAGGVADYESLDLGMLLFSEVPEERLRPKLDAFLQPLREHPELAETLVAYFACDMDVPATARKLHVHPNTLRYRLARVEKLLGRSLRQPATVAALHIALQAAPPPRA
jgi:purine catabolism regulator